MQHGRIVALSIRKLCLVSFNREVFIKDNFLYVKMVVDLSYEMVHATVDNVMELLTG